MFHSSSSSYEEPSFHLPLTYSSAFPCLFSSSLPSCLHLPKSSPVRRVSSAGDLQGINGLLGSSEERGAVAVAAAAGRAVRYSAEERKERIERYRSKRQQRNFHKKITYACRKALADSRPRVRGRFARNGEAEVAEINSYEFSNGYKTLEEINGEWWREMETPLVTEEEEECYYCYEGIWDSFDDVFSVS